MNAQQDSKLYILEFFIYDQAFFLSFLHDIFRGDIPRLYKILYQNLICDRFVLTASVVGVAFGIAWDAYFKINNN